MDNMDYNEYLKSKVYESKSVGFDVDRDKLNPQLKEFQKDIVLWSLKKGKSAIFADCGLGKTFMQLEWAKHVHAKTNKPILILAPLAVSEQTKDEGAKFNICDVNIARSQKDIVNGINITNYEMIDHFNANEFSGIVLDESSILKSYSGPLKTHIIKMFKNVQYKLACTATPSPNDHMELLNHPEFLDIMQSHQALSIWFINDTQQAGNYKLKGHAYDDFWRWVSSWSVTLSKPSDLGYDDDGYNLPELETIEHIVPVDMSIAPDGELIRMPSMSATSYHAEKRLTAIDRAKKTAEIVSESNDQYLVWCDTNYEADELKKLIPDAVEVRGSDKNEFKEQSAKDFKSGKIRVLISKPKMFGYGLNFQNCHNVVFCGLSFSYESFYQALKRVLRFGQKHKVKCHIVLGETEYNLINTMKEKERKFNELRSNVVKTILQTQNIKEDIRFRIEYVSKTNKTDEYTLVNGDCIEEIKNIPDRSLGLQIFSPPFSNLYIYSDSYRDMGNTTNDMDFMFHFDYLIPELLRTLKNGRLCAVHCKDLVKYINRDGQSGLRDFSGELIRAFESHGFTYHNRITIWKCPVTEMTRTKAHGLLYKQFRKDSTYSRVGMPDYILLFRKWSDDYIDDDPVTHTKEDFELWEWQQYASPVWATIGDNVITYNHIEDVDDNGFSNRITKTKNTGNFHTLTEDIKQTNVLNIKAAREDKDEKHICPLQLDVIERLVRWYSNPNDIVFTPFMGIGSECYQALKMGRRAYGIELKESYYKQAVANCEAVIAEQKEELLF